MEQELTKERLRELQALPLERKIGFTIARITEFYDHFDGNVYVSFSGGKDSTVLLYIARKLFPDIKAMFVDTGLEYPEIRDFVKTWDNVDWVRPEKTFLQVIKEYGYPVIGKEVAFAIDILRRHNSPWARQKFRIDPPVNMKKYDYSKYRYLVDAPFKISDRCCGIMKKKTAHKYGKENKLYPIIATMTEESQLRETAWLRRGCNAFNGKDSKSNPMSFWLEQDVLKYIKMMNIPIASVYGNIETEMRGGEEHYYTTGVQRTGCMFCCFGVQRDKEPNRFQRMYYTHPKQWDYCINKLGLKEVLEYINVPYMPKEETDEQPNLF